MPFALSTLLHFQVHLHTRTHLHYLPTTYKPPALYDFALLGCIDDIITYLSLLPSAHSIHPAQSFWLLTFTCLFDNGTKGISDFHDTRTLRTLPPSLTYHCNPADDFFSPVHIVLSRFIA